MLAESPLSCRWKLDMYNLKSSAVDSSISMVKQASLMHKTVRRQMAAISVRNCMSHICAIAYSHFVLSSDKYCHPPGSMYGATNLMKMVEKVTGTNVRPIKKHYLMNNNGTPLYFYAGISRDDKRCNRWTRVSNECRYIRKRNISSTWKHT